MGVYHHFSDPAQDGELLPPDEKPKKPEGAVKEPGEVYDSGADDNCEPKKSIVRMLPHKNLAFELLKKLLNDEIRIRSRKNIVQGRAFSEMLEDAINKYQKRAITSAEVIQELIKLAKDMQKAQSRGEGLGLNDEELAFYDALAQNESAVDVMGDQNLCIIAHELLEKVKQNVTIDWSLRENARARIRILVKRILRRYGYPPDLERAATELVLEQTEVLCNEWV